MNNNKIQLAVKVLIDCIEPGTTRDGLIKTPVRVAKAYEEMFDGYTVDIDNLFTAFDGEARDQIVIVRDISFVSTCEHHMLPFAGLAHVAYLPNGSAIGASKIPRLVLAYAHRLQLQERIAEQVANTLMEKLNPQGVAVIMQAQHECMQCRGVKAVGSSLVNSIMLGRFREDSTLRAELLSLLTLTGGG